MKFVLFVEGHTERKAVAGFVKRWLDGRLDQPVGVKTVRFDGWAELVKDVKTKAHLHLGQPDVIAVLSLLDLHGPTIHPNDQQTADERRVWGTGHLQEKVGHDRYFHFFAVHEVEAWLLSQPEIFPREVRDLFPPQIRTPERVNFNEPPAYLLDRLYRQAQGKSYKKVVYGTQLFSKLDVNIAREKCPQLRAMLDKMLMLAKAAGH